MKQRKCLLLKASKPLAVLLMKKSSIVGFFNFQLLSEGNQVLTCANMALERKMALT